MDKYKPVRKVTSGTIAATITYLILIALPEFNITLTPEIIAIIPVVAGFLTAYLVPNEKVKKEPKPAK